MLRPLLRVAAASLLLVGCSDLSTSPSRTPSKIELETDTITATAGSLISVKYRVLDQNGVPLDRIPGWAVPLWASSDSQRVAVDGVSLRFQQPGKSFANVTVAGLKGYLVARVNPRQLALRVQGAYLTQSVQRMDGSVPLIAGREALLRVFLTGDQTSYFRPRVRVRLFHGGALQRTLELEPATDSVPLRVDEGALVSSWNASIPGALVQPGLSYSVEADPDGRVPLAGGSVSRLPAQGATAVFVQAVPRFSLRLIPITQSLNGLTGHVSGVTGPDAMMTRLRGMWPLGEVSVDVRQTYTTSASLGSDGAGWRELLSEVRALQIAEGADRYYYGVVRTKYLSGVAGIGYVPGRAALGWDAEQSSADVMVHELGHNFGLRHAPCGNPANPDPAFPYTNARLGAYGYDAEMQRAVSPGEFHDVMSYCKPQWVSDYNFRKVLGLRGPATASTSAAQETGLLVWGRMDGDGVVLEPAFELSMRPSLPSGEGPYRVEGYDASGTRIFSYAFQGDAVDHAAGARSFAFAIPARVAQPQRLARIRLVGPGGEAWQVRDAEAAPVPELTGSADGARATLSWRGPRGGVALVRDPRTGAILSFARGGRVQLPSAAGELEVLMSDGVRTTRRLVRAQ